MKRRVTRLIVFNSSGQVLLLQSALSGSIKFPGGGINENETSANAALRKLQQETGLTVKAGDLKYLGEVTEIISSENPTLVHNLVKGAVQQVEYYRVTVSAEPTNWDVTKIADCLWVNLDEVMESLTYPTQQEAFSAFILGKELIGPLEWTSISKDQK